MQTVTAEQLKAKAAEALRLRDALLARKAQAQKNPATWAQYQKVMGGFNAGVAAYVQKITGVYDSAKSAFVKLYQWALDDADGLGNPVVWVGGVAAAGAAMAAMTAWIADAVKVVATLDAQTRMVQAGATPAAAAAAVKGAASAAHGDSLGDQVQNGARALAGLVLVVTLAAAGWSQRERIAAAFTGGNGKRAKG